MVDDLTASIFDKAVDSLRRYSKGGMKSKLSSIAKAVDVGIPCLLANGKQNNMN
jgi:glutamate 5-kinase